MMTSASEKPGNVGMVHHNESVMIPVNMSSSQDCSGPLRLRPYSDRTSFTGGH